MSDEASATAREALDLAKDVDRRIVSHEDICALRYQQLHNEIAAVRTEVSSSVGDIKKVLGWVGSLAVVTMLAALGFFLKAQHDSMQRMEDTLRAYQTKSGYERIK